MTDLMYSTISQSYATDFKDTRHPQKVMRELGITYRLAVPQSLYDSWWFFGCENVPAELPPWLKVHDFGYYRKLIGYGLTEADAAMLETLR